FCSLLAPSDAILFQEGVSVKLRLPHYAARAGVLSGEISGGGTVSKISYQASITAGIRIKGEEHGNKTRR
ncbi:hypothetical protein PSZ80_23685, partial [Shigella sonnei]